MDDDLDAELARLEEEIQNEETEAAAVPLETKTRVASPHNAPDDQHKSHDGNGGRESDRKTTALVQAHASRALSNAEIERSTEARNSSADVVLVAAKQPVLRMQPPEWQRELLERDYERIHGKSFDTTSSSIVGPIGPTSVNYRPDAPSSVGTDRPGLSNLSTGPISVRPSAHSSGATSQHGQWVWNGTEWIYEPESRTGAASQAVQPGIAVGEAAGPRQPATPRDNANKLIARSHHENAQRPRNEDRNARHVRSAAGAVWVDPTMEEWPEDDFRIFVGDLAADATEEELTDAFKRYSSFNMARVVMDKRTGECKGYGFVSFAKGEDMVRALREMNGKYVGTRPVKLKKSNWHKKELTADRKKDLRVFKSVGLVSKRHSKLP